MVLRSTREVIVLFDIYLQNFTYARAIILAYNCSYECKSNNSSVVDRNSYETKIIKIASNGIIEIYQLPIS